MPGPSRPSFPFSSEPNVRRLGVGGGRGDRPIKAQLVVALVAVFVLVAVPVWFMRRPGKPSGGASSAAAANSVATMTAALASALPVVKEAGAQAIDERIVVSPPQRVRCGASPTRGGEGALCEELATFESALVKAVKEGVACTPKTAQKQEGTINYVLTVDFAKRSLHVFPGQSGGWKGAQARRAAQCVKRAIVPPVWESVQHRHRYYQIAALTTYKPPRPAAPVSSVSPGAPGQPSFD
jgi:hypothetical protein